MSEKININSATAAELATLTGIGPELAQRIVEYRELEGAFDDLFELVAVPGISARMVRAFEDEVMLSEQDPQESADALEEEILEEDSEDLAISVEDEEATAVSESVEDTETTTPISKPSPENIEETIQISASTPEPEESIMPASPIENIPPSNQSTNADLESRAQRRGCFSIIAGAIFGAILGTVLTLVILFNLNQGTLEYNAQNSRLQGRLNDEIQARTEQLETMSEQLHNAATQEAELQDALATSSASLTRMEESMANTEATVVAAEKRIDEISGAAENFNIFLLGLRDVVDELEPSLPTSTPTTRPTNTAVSATAPSDTEQIATLTSTAVRATRTPRPTATALFTSTPTSQP